MHRRTALVGLSAPIIGARAVPRTLSLRAEPEHFNAKTLEAAADSVVLRASMRIRSFAGTDRWPTAAYTGVHQGPDRNESVQVLVIRNRASDGFLVLGWRLVVGGKEVHVQSVENVPLDAWVQVSLTFASGLANVRVNGSAPTQIATPFRRVSPYVSVSSGEAEFKIDA